MSLTYLSGEEVQSGDRVLYHGEAGKWSLSSLSPEKEIRGPHGTLNSSAVAV